MTFKLTYLLYVGIWYNPATFIILAVEIVTVIHTSWRMRTKIISGVLTMVIASHSTILILQGNVIIYTVVIR